MSVRPGSAPFSAISPLTIAAVFLGGATGVALRAVIMQSSAAPHTDLLLLLGINTIGSFALGMLTALLTRNPDTRNRETRNQDVLTRLFGTGLLGGFTSYSAVALVSSSLLGIAPVLAVGFGVGSILIGVLAAWFGGVLVSSQPAPAPKRSETSDVSDTERA